MYEVCMSVDRRVEPDFDQTELSWEGEAPASLGPEHLIYDEDQSSGVGGLLMKSGLVILIAISAFGSYQFLKDSNANPQLANSKPAYNWSGKPVKTDNNQELVTFENQAKTVRKIDLTKTASVKKTPKAISKPAPIKPKPSPGATFHIVQPGDTLSAIGRKFQISSTEIIEINAIKNPKLIKPGMKLFVSR